MRVEQRRWSESQGWTGANGTALGDAAQLVLLFGGTGVLDHGERLREVQEFYPRAALMGCSTAGEIYDTTVADDTLTVTAVEFERTRLRGASLNLNGSGDSVAAGRRLAGELAEEDLRHVLVLSDGLRVNGSDLVRGLTDNLPAAVGVTGGLAGDGARFEQTLAFYGDAPASGTIAALGLYGDSLRVGCGSRGGWDPFGPERIITRSEGNILYELDGQSALALYRKYLGEYAKDLPASGLLFPLSLCSSNGRPGIVRTILSTDEAGQSLIFAGDVPQGERARFMKANFERLIDGATAAAHTSCDSIGADRVDLALLISCVGRKMVLKQRIEEEVESVRDVLGRDAVLTGFYSYGEISPFAPEARCELHNQTMTITTFSES